MRDIISAVEKYWLALTLCVFFGINVLSLYPLESLPLLPGNDKTHHFLAYAALMFPVALRKPSHWLLMGIFFALWSGCIELIQPYVNRHGTWLDMAANAGGLFFGFVAAVSTNYFLSERDSSH